MILHLPLSPDIKDNIVIMGFKRVGNGWKTTCGLPLLLFDILKVFVMLIFYIR